MSSPAGRTVRDIAIAGSVSVFCLAAYASTLGEGPYWQDSGLFLAALKAGGGLLPPGYPAYLLLGRPFVALLETARPGHTLAFYGNAFSMVWAALAAGLVTLAGLWLPRLHRSIPTGSLSIDIGAILGGLLAGLSYSLWFQAVTAEAYAMNACFTAAVLCLGIRLAAEGSWGPEPTRLQKRLGAAVLAVYGLSFGNHPVTIVLAPSLLLAAFELRNALRRPKVLLGALACFLLPAVLPYAYLPWSALRHPENPYGGVLSPGGLAAQAGGTQWTTDTANFGLDWQRFAALPAQMGQEFFLVGALGLLLALANLRQVLRGARRYLAALLLPAFLLPLLYIRGGEYDFWLLSAWIPLFLLASTGLQQFLSRLSSRAGLAVSVLLVAGVLAPAFLMNRPLIDRRTEFTPEDFGRNLLRHLEPDAVFVAVSDQENALTYYLEVAENPRPDVVRIDAGTMRTPWFESQLRHRYPAFRFQAPEGAANGAASMEDWLSALSQAALSQGRAFYISTRPSAPPPAGASWVPAGGLHKLSPRGPAAFDARDWDFVFRNPTPFERSARAHAPELGPDGVIRREPYLAQIRRFHVQAFKDLGDWSLDHDDYNAAARAYQQAVDFDPALENTAVFFGLGKSLFVTDRTAQAKPWLLKVPATAPTPILVESSLYLGQIFAAEGDWRRATEYFDAVRRLAPELADRLPRAPEARP